MSSHSLDSIRQRINAFVRARDWERFHDPKNLSMALASEVGELCGILRWVDNTDSNSLTADRRADLAAEIGDIGILLLRLCDRLGLDLVTAVSDKLEANDRKYPVSLATGKADPPTPISINHVSPHD